MGTSAACLGFFKRLAGETTGGIGLLVGLSLPVVIGSVGLAFDINRGLEQRVANQRAADMAALGAAMAYKAGKDDAILKPTAVDLVMANGLSGATIDAAVVNDFPNAGDKAVKVIVTSQVPYTLARVLGLNGDYDVAVTSVASLNAQAPYAAPCFLALAGEKDALTTNGGASITAPDCSVAAIGSIDNGGGNLTAHDVISGSGDISTGAGAIIAETLRYAGSFDAPFWNESVPPADHRYNEATTLIDPWATDATLLSARTQLGSSTALPAFSDPDTNCSGGQNWSLDSSPNNSNPAKAYWTGSGYDIPAGTYCIKKLTVGGGVTVKFANGSNIKISQGFSNGGDAVDFGHSSLFVNGGFDSGSKGVTVGDGLLWIGHGNVNFQGAKGDGNVMVNDTLSLGGGQKLVMGSGQHYFGGLKLSGGDSAVMGDGDLVAVKGIDIGGGSELSVGNGNVTIGSDNSGTAIKLSGSGRLFMGDGKFSANGDIDTEGGSRIVFGRTDNHYINGDMRIAGAALFGAGRYTINGDLSNKTGGTVWPYISTLTGKTYGQTVAGESVSGFGMAGVDVTFILAGAFDLAGAASTKLVAAGTTSPGGAIANLLVDSLTDDKIDWTGGSTNVFDGTVHFPNAAVKMAGGNSTSGNGACFTLIANYIKLTGGAVAGSACPEMSGNSGSGSSAAIRLLK